MLGEAPAAMDRALPATATRVSHSVSHSARGSMIIGRWLGVLRGNSENDRSVKRFCR